MAVICITGSTDGIGLSAARMLLKRGHRVLVHARSEERGEPVLAALAGDVGLVVGDLSDLRQLPELAEAIGEVDVLVHNAGVWVDEPDQRSVQGHELTFAVNALAPHALTRLLGERVRERLVFLGSGMAGSGRVEPGRLGRASEPQQAYADSKALDVVLALAWQSRRPDLQVGAVDPGWVKTKLASPGAPGEVDAGGRRVAHAAVEPDWPGGYTNGRDPVRVSRRLADENLQGRVVAELDALSDAAQK